MKSFGDAKKHSAMELALKLSHGTNKYRRELQKWELTGKRKAKNILI